MLKGVIASLLASAIFAGLSYYATLLTPLTGEEIFGWRQVRVVFRINGPLRFPSSLGKSAPSGQSARSWRQVRSWSTVRLEIATIIECAATSSAGLALDTARRIGASFAK